MTETQQKELHEIVEPFLIDNEQSSGILVEEIIRWHLNQSSIAKVQKFMLTANQPVNIKPTYDRDRMKLRLSLILEELTELAEACGQVTQLKQLLLNKIKGIEDCVIYDQPNEIKCLDALIDLRYVTDGAGHEFGVISKFDEAFDEVHKSNMSKFSNTKEEAIATLEKYQAQGIECYNKEVNGLIVTYRSLDHKVLKSVNFKEPNLKQFINP